MTKKMVKIKKIKRQKINKKSKIRKRRRIKTKIKRKARKEKMILSNKIRKLLPKANQKEVWIKNFKQ